MKKYPDIGAVIIDFGFTLSSDYYFRELGLQYTDRIAQFVFSRDSEIGRRWMGGLISSHEVSERLSDCLGLSADEIQSALARGCSRMSFNQSVWNFARTQRADGRNLALVTGNADIFREVIVPSHGLDREFDSIVCCSDFGVELPLNHPPIGTQFSTLSAQSSDMLTASQSKTLDERSSCSETWAAQHTSIETTRNLTTGSTHEIG